MEHIADKILNYLAADANNAVVLTTALKAVVLQQKHVVKFAKAGYELITKKANEPGFYLQNGKSKVYYHGVSIRFGSYK